MKTLPRVRRARAARGRNRRFFGIELLKLYLIQLSVHFKIRKKCSITPPYFTVEALLGIFYTLLNTYSVLYQRVEELLEMF